MELRYQGGHPHHLVATRPFALGNTGVNLARGQEVFFDGTKAQVDGSEYVCPQLRGAVKAGWLMPFDEYDENVGPVATRANIQVRHPTQGGNPMQPRQSMSTEISEEERVIGNTQTHAAQTRNANTGYVRGQTPVNPRNVQAGQLVKSQRGVMEVELQDGQVVDRAPLKTAAGEKAKHTRTSADNASAVESQISKLKIEPVQGATRDELIERMSPEEREEYLARISANKAQYVDEPPVVAESRQVVNRIASNKTGQQEGIRYANSVGGGTEIADPAGLSTGKPVESTYDQEGIRFRSVNGPKRDLQPSVHPRQASQQAAPAAPAAPAPAAYVMQLSPAVRMGIAKSVCADVPDNYDFAAPAKKKLARISLDFEDRLDIIQAIYMAETEDFKPLLVQEFPAAFPQSGA
jgi:hypothetical protein